MSSTPRIVPNLIAPLINAQSMAASFNGPATNIQGLSGICYDLVWTGTPTGTFQVQVSNTYAPSATGGATVSGNWTTLPSGSFQGNYPIPAGSAGSGFLDVIGTEAAWIRLQYTATSGTGTLTVLPSGKVL